MTSEDWKPRVDLDLTTASLAAFQDRVARFYVLVDGERPPGPLALPNGWYTITPQMSEDFLRRNRANRQVSFATVKKYWQAMSSGDWRATGQALILDREGKALDLQHRCWAGYLGQVSFKSYVITDASPEDDLFAYIDDCKPRSAGDALFTSGMNGISNYIAGAAKLAWKYENNAIGIIQQPRIRDMSTREVLEYTRTHPKLGEAAHTIMGSFKKAVSIIGSKPVSIFFGWQVIEHYSFNILTEFFDPLGIGANLEEDSPILGLRNRLLREEEEAGDLKQPRRLALLIKAFNLHVDGRKLSPKGLSLRDNEKFPRFAAQPAADFSHAA
jgi:hypothetical protein